MAKNRSNKKALIGSVASLTLTGAMLAGTTLAWFTDTVVTQSNKIETGNLDLSVAKWNGKDYIDVESEDGDAVLFTRAQGDDFWEPGFTDVAAIKVTNTGTLALDYKINLVALEEVKLGDLAEKIEVYLLESVDLKNETLKLENWEDFLAQNPTLIGTLNGVFDGDTVFESTIVPKAAEAEESEADYAFIALHLPSNVGNEYQGATTPQFKVVFNAKQSTHEADDFNAQFDEKAEYADVNLGSYVPVASQEDLTAALEAGKNVLLTNNLTLEKLNINQTEENQMIIDANGYTITCVYPEKQEQKALLITGKNIVIKNAVFEKGNNTPWGIVTNGVAYYNCTFNEISPYIEPNQNIIVDSCTFKNTSLQVCYQQGGGSATPESITTTITNNTFIVDNATNAKSHAFVLNASKGATDFGTNFSDYATIEGNIFRPTDLTQPYWAGYVTISGQTLETLALGNNTYQGEAVLVLNTQNTEAENCKVIELTK